MHAGGDQCCSTVASAFAGSVPSSPSTPHDRLAEHAAGRVDLVDREGGAGEHRRAGEGQVTGLRQQRADAQRAGSPGVCAGRRRARLGGRRRSSPAPTNSVLLSSSRFARRSAGCRSSLADGSPASVKPPQAQRDAAVRDVLAGLDQRQAGRRAVARRAAGRDAVDLRAIAGGSVRWRSGRRER